MKYDITAQLVECLRHSICRAACWSKRRLSSLQQSWRWDKTAGIVRREWQIGDLSAEKLGNSQLRLRLSWDLTGWSPVKTAIFAISHVFFFHICKWIRACSSFRCSKLRNSEISCWDWLICFQRPYSCRLNPNGELYEVRDASWISRRVKPDKEALPHTFQAALFINGCSWSDAQWKNSFLKEGEHWGLLMFPDSFRSSHTCEVSVSPPLTGEIVSKGKVTKRFALFHLLIWHQEARSRRWRLSALQVRC